MEKKPHKHAELIIAWANGADIQYRKPRTGEWEDTTAPAFVEDYEYRVKPGYPETTMTRAEATKLNEEVAALGNLSWAEDVIVTINAGLRHAINNGQVVTREEFKRVSDEANKAVRSLNAFGFTDHGGELWKPPLGNCFVITASNG